MRYRPLGDSGLMVSVTGLGCNNAGRRLDLEATRAVINAALESGITLLDTSDSYGGGGGSEELLGEVLAGRRDEVVLATKFGHQDFDMGYGPAAGAKGGRGYIRRAVERSLRRLRTDYLDLYQIHTPDPVTPIAETLAALGELVAEGKVRYLGNSNFTGWQIADAAHVARAAGLVPFVSAQNHWSLLERGAEAEVVPAARQPAGGPPRRSGLPPGPASTRSGSRGGRARAQRPGCCRRGAGRAAGVRVCDRRRDLAGTGEGQRRGGGLDPDGRRPRRAQPDRAAARSGVMTVTAPARPAA